MEVPCRVLALLVYVVPPNTTVSGPRHVEVPCHVLALLVYVVPPNTTVSGPRHVEVLKEKLNLHRDSHKCTMFIQDGAPCHRSKVVTDFPKKNNISVLE